MEFLDNSLTSSVLVHVAPAAPPPPPRQAEEPHPRPAPPRSDTTCRPNLRDLLRPRSLSGWSAGCRRSLILAASLLRTVCGPVLLVPGPRTSQVASGWTVRGQFACDRGARSCATQSTTVPPIAVVRDGAKIESLLGDSSKRWWTFGTFCAGTHALPPIHPSTTRALPAGRNPELVDVEVAHGSLSREHAAIVHGCPPGELTNTPHRRAPVLAPSSNPSPIPSRRRWRRVRCQGAANIRKRCDCCRHGRLCGGGGPGLSQWDVCRPFR